jgi:hypothetical protein
MDFGTGGGCWANYEGAGILVLNEAAKGCHLTQPGPARPSQSINPAMAIGSPSQGADRPR